MNSRVTTGILLAVLVAFGVVLYRQQQTINELSRRPGVPSAATAGADTPQLPKALPALSTIDAPVSLAGAPLRGQTAARVAMLEFSDFQCPYCARYVRDTLPRIDADYVKTGKIRYAFRQFPLDSIHPNARGAAMASLCGAEQGKFWDLHDRFFANQRALDMPSLILYGAGLGLDEDAYETCLKQGRHEDVVSRDRQAAIELGFTGTPAFVVGRLGPDGVLRAVRRISGAQPYSVFQSAIDDVLSGR